MREVKLGSLDIKFIDGDRGKNYPKQEDLLEKGYCLFLSAKNITSDGFQLNDLVFITEEKDNLLRKGKLEDNDIIITTRGTIGNVCIYNNKIPFKNVRINSGMLIIRNESLDINTDYLYQFLKSDIFRERTRTFAFGAAVPQLPISTLVNIKINLPPLETQKKIASILSGYDDLIENNLKRIKILEEMAQQTYEEWFVRMRFPGHDASRASASLNPETGLPEGWEKVKLGDEFIIKNGKSFKGVNTDNPYDNKIYGSNGIIGYTNFSNTRNSVIIGRVGAYCGSINYCSQDYWATDNTIYVEEKSNGISIELAYFILKKLNLRTFAGGAAQPLLTQNTINQLEILKPSKDLIFEFSKMCKNINKQILNLTNQNQRLREARDILLPRLMMGMIEV